MKLYARLPQPVLARQKKLCRLYRLSSNLPFSLCSKRPLTSPFANGRCADGHETLWKEGVWLFRILAPFDKPSTSAVSTKKCVEILQLRQGKWKFYAFGDSKHLSPEFFQNTNFIHVYPLFVRYFNGFVRSSKLHPSVWAGAEGAGEPEPTWPIPMNPSIWKNRSQRRCPMKLGVARKRRNFNV